MGSNLSRIRRSNEMLRTLIFSISSFAVLGLDVAAQTKAPPTPAEPPKQEEEAPAMAIRPPNYVFQSRGRRDPFINPVPKPVRTVEQTIAERPKGLRGVMLSEARIAAIVVSKDAPELTRALIRTSSGRAYAARTGDALYDAVIKDIRRDGVVFAPTSKESGTGTARDVVLKVSP